MIRSRLSIPVVVLFLALHVSGQEPGMRASKQALLKDLPPTADHPLPRKVIAVREEAISSRPADETVLVVHHRAPLEPNSLNDDQVVIALKTGTEYTVLRQFQSDAGVVNGHLDSQTDFAFDFISIDSFRFLYLRQRFAGTGGTEMDFVYTISSDGVLSEIPFEEVRTSKLLKPGEELRNGATHFQDGRFQLETGIYGNDPECCPSGGTLNVLYRLEGGFQQLGSNAFRPEFNFVVAKEWRSK